MTILLVILLLNAVIPTKFFRPFGVPAGDLVTVILYVFIGAKVLLLDPRRHFRKPLPVLWLICSSCVALSAVTSYLASEDLTYWFWNVKQIIHYAFIFPLVALPATADEYKRAAKIYVIVAIASAAALHVFQIYPELVDPDFGTGSIQMDMSGRVRIFSPGMQYVVFAAIALVPFLRVRPVLVLVWLFLVSGLIWTVARTFFLMLSVAIVLYLVWLFGRRILHQAQVGRPAVILAVAISVLAVPVALSQSEYISYLSSRFMVFRDLQSSSIGDFDTFGWRLRDAANAIAEVETPREIAFGVFAKYYRTEEWEGASVHIGYIGIYYHYGLLGVAVFAALLILITTRMVQALRRVRSRNCPLEEEYVIALALVWAGFCIDAAMGGLFVAGPGIIALTFIWFGLHLAVESAPEPHRGGIRVESTSLGSSNLGRNAVLQPGIVSTRGD